MELRPLTAIDFDFLASFTGDPEFSDPMLASEEQRHRNLQAALEQPERHAVLGVFREGKQTGLFVFLALREEKYLELLAGLSKDPETYEAVLSYLAAGAGILSSTPGTVFSLPPFGSVTPNFTRSSRSWPSPAPSQKSAPTASSPFPKNMPPLILPSTKRTPTGREKRWRQLRIGFGSCWPSPKGR